MRFRSDRQRRAVFANMNAENKFSYVPIYTAGDISAMGVDAVGTAGSVAVAVVPLAILAGGLYVGAKIVSKGMKHHEHHKKKKSKFSRDEMVSDYYDYGDAGQYGVQV